MGEFESPRAFTLLSVFKTGPFNHLGTSAYLFTSVFVVGAEPYEQD